MTFRKRPVSKQPPLIWVRSFDLMMLILSPSCALLLRDNTYLQINHFSYLLGYTAISTAATLPCMHYFGVNRIAEGYFAGSDAVKIFKAVFAGILLTLLIGFTISRLTTLPRSLPIIHFLLLAGGLIASRVFVAQRAQQAGLGKSAGRDANNSISNVLIVGANRHAFHYASLLEAIGPASKRVLGFLAEDRRMLHHSLGGREVLGDIGDLPKLIDEFADHGMAISEIVIAIRRTAISAEALASIYDAASARDISTVMVEDLLGVRDGVAPGGVSAASPTQTLSGESGARPNKTFYWRAKRTFDFLAAGTGLVLLLPVLALIAIAVLLDCGRPLTFWQERTGRFGRKFFVYKFRTMRPKFNAEGQEIDRAARISAVGAFLRRTHLDELPQLFNVITGDMALVGPRPLLPVDQPEAASRRLSVRPGLTGWAQINGGERLNSLAKGQLDEWYVANASMMLDLRIIAATVIGVLRHAVTPDARGANAGRSKSDSEKLLP